MDIVKELLNMQDLEYKDFHSRLMPTVPKEKIIGVRVPALRKFAKELFKAGEYENFLVELPHRYYEEDNVHAFLIEKMQDFETAIKFTEAFLPYIDNWATCDMFMPKVFKKQPEKLLPYVNKWLESDKTYIIRYGIKILMALFLDEKFEESYMEKVASVCLEEYYVKMMVAWYFATALDKQRDMALSYIKNRKLDSWTHNKAIQKAIESFRISKEDKSYLRTLKV
ncbi:MAG: DNA alkylation repair protein [Clostridia bacterium]|nr:DNA alkylation repair protein [Clostridia bacterium]